MTEEQHIQKGFNAGYQLQKHKPELSQAIQTGFVDKEHPYAKGFMAGSQEWVKEQAHEASKGKSSYLDNYFNKIKNQTKGKSSDKATDKDKDIDL